MVEQEAGGSVDVNTKERPSLRDRETQLEPSRLNKLVCSATPSTKGVQAPPQWGGAWGFRSKLPPTRDGLGGSNSPPRLPPTVGGSTPQAEILRILVQKPCVLTGILSSSEKSECSPPQWGGLWGGVFRALGGSRGEHSPPSWKGVRTPLSETMNPPSRELIDAPREFQIQML